MIINFDETTEKYTVEINVRKGDFYTTRSFTFSRLTPSNFKSIQKGIIDLLRHIGTMTAGPRDYTRL